VRGRQKKNNQRNWREEKDINIEDRQTDIQTDSKVTITIHIVKKKHKHITGNIGEL